MLAAAYRVSLDADQPQQGRDDALDLVVEQLRIAVPGQLRGLERVQNTHLPAGAAAWGIDGKLGRVPQAADAIRPLSRPGQPLAPQVRHAGRVGIEIHVLAARIVGVDPRPEILGPQLGEGEEQVCHVALGVDDQRRHAVEGRFLQ